MPIDGYVEVGTKRVFAGALQWPGWCRSGPRVDDAIEALVAYGPRYAAVLKGSVRFIAPKDELGVTIVERLTGDARRTSAHPRSNPVPTRVRSTVGG